MSPVTSLNLFFHIFKRSRLCSIKLIQMSPSVGILLVLTKHPIHCKYWSKWASSASADIHFIYHCDKASELVCGPKCILRNSHRIPSIPTTWGSSGVVRAEVEMYRTALSLGVTHAMTATESCIPLIRLRDIEKHFLGDRAWLTWSEPDSRYPGRSPYPCQMFKLMTRPFMEVVIAMKDEDITRFDANCIITNAEVQGDGRSVDDVFCPEETCIIQFIVNTKGWPWLRANAECRTTTLVVFEHDRDHHPMWLDLHEIRQRYLRTSGFLLARKVPEGGVPSCFPLRLPTAKRSSPVEGPQDFKGPQDLERPQDLKGPKNLKGPKDLKRPDRVPGHRMELRRR